MDAFEYREAYCPAHFGNSYEVMGTREMAEALREAVFWGFNAYGDWFDPADIKNPFDNPRNEYLHPQALWERKVESYREANRLNLQTTLVVTPNVVFLDQLRTELLAETDPHIFGQLLCPSKAEARRIILDNHRAIFESLSSHGVRLDAITGGPYDYGGCACQKCVPWILTFGCLYAEIHEIAKEFYPEIKARLFGWWWSQDEHREFSRWADAEEPGRFASLSTYIKYGETATNADFPLPQGCDKHAFVHIGYADEGQPRDLYGAWGPTVAAKRMGATLRDLAAKGATGFSAYSEGVFDDINKALLAGQASGKFKNAEETLKTYAERYFGASGPQREDWAAWITRWANPFQNDVGAARTEFDLLARPRPQGWRFAQLEAKLRLFEAHHAVAGRSEWNDDRMQAADRFFGEREHLYRDVWKLGLVRHVLHPRYHQPEWFDDWSARKEAIGDAGQMRPEA